MVTDVDNYIVHLPGIESGLSAGAAACGPKMYLPKFAQSAVCSTSATRSGYGPIALRLGPAGGHQIGDALADPHARPRVRPDWIGAPQGGETLGLWRS